MTTASINHRPFIAAAVAVAAIAAGSVAVAVSHESNHASAPGQPSQIVVRHDTPRAHHFPATTSGGRVMLSE